MATENLDPVLDQFGTDLIALGQAFKNPNTTITELSKMAFSLGFILQLRLSNSVVISLDSDLDSSPALPSNANENR